MVTEQNIPLATYTITVVPEPNSLWLIGAGLLALGSARCIRTLSRNSKSASRDAGTAAAHLLMATACTQMYDTASRGHSSNRNQRPDESMVNSADVSQTKAQSGAAMDKTNFREDVTLDAAINSADVSLVKSRSGSAIAAGAPNPKHPRPPGKRAGHKTAVIPAP
ncbi:MAG: PEP-CTERM sorting domain-containing protein [Chthoniobacterales bacterium]